MKVITAHVPLPLAEQVDALSARLQRSRGWIVKEALAAWVAQQDPPARNPGFAEARQPFEANVMAETKTARAAVETLKALREKTTLGDVSWQELRDAGRR